MVCACALACQRVSETAQVRQRGPHNPDKRPLLVLFASGANGETRVWIDSVLVRGVTGARNGRVDGRHDRYGQGPGAKFSHVGSGKEEFLKNCKCSNKYENEGPANCSRARENLSR